MNQVVGGVLSNDALLYAKIAGQAYKKAQSEDIDEYICDRSFGQANSSVYVNKSKQEVVLSIRGTNVKNPEDLANDAILNIGLLSKTTRFIELSKRLEQILNKYKGYKITLVGHSLGGELSRQLLLMYPKYIDSIHVFNSGAGLNVAIKSLYCKFKKTGECRIMKNKMHLYNVTGDVISFMSQFLPNASQTIEKPVSMNPIENHKNDNFIGSGFDVKQLKQMCKDKSIKGYSKMNRKQLIDSLQ